MLVAVNGVELTYDENGNVLTYGDREYNWNTGRHLESITDGDNEYSYTYDESGIRTSKTVNGVTTYYNTSDGVILSQTDGTNTMYFQCDTNGTPLGFIYNGTQYLYMTNQMGDVISITDAQGNELVEYEYDEWGKLILTRADNQLNESIANINPIRYRGYYYDAETEYYYLQSRYYDPSICRFINSDIPEIAGMSKGISAGTNLFAYCNNDSVNYSDISGQASNPTYGTLVRVFLKTYLLKGKTIKSFSNIAKDSNGLRSMTIKYKKSKNNTNKLKLTFGYRNEWKKSTTWANQIKKKKKLITNYINQLNYYVSPTQSYSDYKISVAKTITVDVAVASIVIGSGFTAAKIALKYNKVWGKNGRDANNKQKYVLFHVSQERGLNGWYIFKYSTKKVIKL